MHHLLAASALDQATAIRDGEVTSRELTQASLEAIEQLDPEIHAMLDLRPDQSLAHADDADRSLRADGPHSVLHGVPYVAKDLLHARGWKTTFGSAAFAGRHADTNSVAVERLVRAGAVLVGKANTPEFGLAAETTNQLGPDTLNPWDVSRTPGGSSGGTAAAVAAGMCAFGLGTDAGGSIRLPAAFCGLVGVKPTYGRVPLEDVQAGWVHPTDTVGPLSRSVSDAAAVLALIAGHDARDATSRRTPVPDYLDAMVRSEGSMSVIVGDLGMGRPSRDVAAVVQDVLAAVDGLDVRKDVEPADVVAERHPFLLMWTLLACAWYAQVGELVDSSPDRFAEYTHAFVDAGREFTVRDYLAAEQEARQLRERIDQLLSTADVLIVPATAVTAWPLNTPPEEIDGEPAAAEGGITYGALPYLAAFSITGHPVVSVPCGWDAHGLPVGVQVVARHWEEATAIRAARLIERHADVGSRWPAVSVRELMESG